jgi:hypothetical protein
MTPLLHPLFRHLLLFVDFRVIENLIVLTPFQ